MSINFNGALSGPKSCLFRSLFKTLSSVFPEIYLFASKKDNPHCMQNIIFFTLKQPLNLSRTKICNRAFELTHSKVSVPDYVHKAQQLYQSPVYIEDVPILSDNSPPPDGELHLYTLIGQTPERKLK
ncbi:MAG: hypothetical protein CVU88_07910 [Firmicutes bacterium HGW-Firmicutes-13]|nr:MAG: hypothetical protein CVU88_07910 [Firmicutes bacterium HGW-Firmicutes-13]